MSLLVFGKQRTCQSTIYYFYWIIFSPSKKDINQKLFPPHPPPPTQTKHFQKMYTTYPSKENFHFLAQELAFLLLTSSPSRFLNSVSFICSLSACGCK